MSNYTYKAVDHLGKIFTDTLECSSKQEVINHLKTRYLMPIEIKQVNIMNMDLAELKIFKPKITTRDLSIFCRQFSTIIGAGISIGTALDILRHQVENQSLKKIIQSVYENIQKGNTLSEAVHECKEFPLLMVSMIEIGEISGRLDLSFQLLATQYDKDLSTEYKIKSAMTYPIIISVLMLAVIIMVIVFVVPNYISMFEEMEAELPKITKALILLSNFIINKWYLLLGIITLVITMFKLWTSSNEGKHICNKIILNIPILGKFVLKLNTAHFSRTMGMLMTSGVSILESLEVTHKILSNTIIKQAIEYIITEVKQGVSLAETIEIVDLFPYMLSSMIRIGEEIGSLNDILCKTADFYDEEIILEIEQLTTFIEPVMTIIIAVIMGLIMLAIVMPTFSLATQI